MRMLAVIFMVFALLSVCPSFAQTPDECLVRVRNMEPMLPKIMDSAKAALQALIPDPAAYETALPPFAKVIADKDVNNFKRYGGLAEAYIYAGDKVKGPKLYSDFMAHATEMLGADDTYPAGVEGDVGLFNFNEKNFEDSVGYLLPAIDLIEKHLTPAVSNNLLAYYLCMAIIRDKGDNKAEALSYSKKVVDLAIRQRQPFDKTAAPVDKTAAPVDKTAAP